MNDTRVIKIISESICPHCSKEIMIANVLSCSLSWVLRKEDVKKAKETLRDKILKSGMKDKKAMEDAIEWVGRDDVLLGNDEIEVLYSQLTNEDKEEQILENNKK